MKWSKSISIVLAIIPGFPLFAFQMQPAVSQEHYSVRVSTGLVALNVAVTRRDGGFVLGLEKDEFKVYEDGIEQEISFFNSEKEPVSWGIILDASGSMKGMIRDVSAAAIHIIDEGTDQDEMFVETFNKKVELVSDFTSDRESLRKSVLDLRADGNTALWDAIAYGLEHIRMGRHQKKVLVVVTDGEDNSSRFRFREIKDRAEEEHVLMYTVGMSDMFMGVSTELSKLAQLTGARAHYPSNLRQCSEAMKQIADDVGRQYSLGYYPTNVVSDGRWRKIRVAIQRPERKGTYVVRTRVGYYAPKQGPAQ